MFKKIFLAGVVMGMTTGVVYADAAPYVGGSLGIGGYHSQAGAIAKLFGGLGTTFFSRFYLGGELYVDLAQFSRYNTTYGYGLSVIPGVMFTRDTMIYARGGLNANYPNRNWGYTTYGAHLGVGLQTGLAGNWSVRGEYLRFNTYNTGEFDLGLVYKFN